MLDSFLTINMPYGMRKNKHNKWIFFNREYSVLGTNKKQTYDHDLFLNNEDYVNYYQNLTPKFIEDLLIKFPNLNTRTDDNGIIRTIWFYEDKTNPNYCFHAKYKVAATKNLNNYLDVIKMLCKLRLKYQHETSSCIVILLYDTIKDLEEYICGLYEEYYNKGFDNVTILKFEQIDNIKKQSKYLLSKYKKTNKNTFIDIAYD